MNSNNIIVAIVILGIVFIVFPLIACHSPNGIELIEKDKSE
jgi:hypothetical protein